jgi:threonine aldolase
MQPGPHVIDLRSDTVTVPTQEMLSAMMAADVGDDVYGEDPMANRLETMVAEMLGKEEAVFVPSGTMANLIAIKAHTRPGDEMICEATSHCYEHEAGGYAAVAGISVALVAAEKGIIDPEQIAPAARPDDLHAPRSRLVVIENTHNAGGGSVYPVEMVAEIGRVCHEIGLTLHMDGARLMNACVALGVTAPEYARHVDSVSLCLSKGLGCPVGSLVAGSTGFAAEARRLRKLLGGAMRQVGYLAAAGVYALEHHVGRLAEDHDNARLLADGVRDCAKLRLTYDPPETNMVYVEPVPPLTGEQFVGTMREHGVLAGLRMVTHIGVNREHIERTVELLRQHFG